MHQTTSVLPTQIQRAVADVAAGASVAGSGFAWLHAANEVLTLIATVVAICSALFAIRYHVTARRKLLREESAE